MIDIVDCGLLYKERHGFITIGNKLVVRSVSQHIILNNLDGRCAIILNFFCNLTIEINCFGNTDVVLLNE